VKVAQSYPRLKLSHILLLGSLPVVATLAVIFSYGFFLTKIGGDTSSLGHRFMLFNSFYDELTFTGLLLGQGFGSMLWLDFLDTYANYIEVQQLLLIYKFGLPIFILWNMLILVGLYTSKRILFLYFCYILGTVTNPYIFDANQLMCVFLLAHFKLNPRISNS